MVATKITKTKFAGSSKIFDTGADGLTDVVRKLAQNSAMTKLELIDDDITDDSSVVVVSSLVGVVQDVALAGHTDAATNSGPKAAFDTEIGIIEDAFATLAEAINKAAGAVGLPLIVDNSTGTSGYPRLLL